MKKFFEIQVGDIIYIDDKIHVVRGKSLGRDWKAIRTNYGLFHVSDDQKFTESQFTSNKLELKKRFFI